MPKILKSIIEWKDVQFITTDNEKSKAVDILISRKILKDDGKPNNTEIEKLAEFYGKTLAKKLTKIRTANKIGIENIKNTLTELVSAKDYKTMYFFTVYIYGLTFWRTPFDIQRLSASLPALKVFMINFSKSFAKNIEEIKTEDAENETAE